MTNLKAVIFKVLIGLLFLGSSVFASEEYSFTVHNSTDTTITEILVSEDGRTWNYFDIGSGVAPKGTMELLWHTSTNNQDCKQYVKAVWSDASEAEPVIFDFCENELELVF